MFTDHLIKLFDRDLNRLKKEILAYSSEDNLWMVEGDVTNTAGNLCLHIIGNLNNFIGAQLGDTGYIRQREQEFGLKHIPRAELIQGIDEVNQVIKNTLTDFDPMRFEELYPLKVFGYDMTTAYFLIHLTTHLNYHLGQINYHRRLIDS